MASPVPHDEEAPLVADALPPQAPKNYTKDVHILSWAFLLIFLAYGAAQNLQSTLNTEQNLGTTSLGILYLSFTFFSMVSSLMVRLLGSNNALVIGTTGYWIFVAANLKPSWYTMVPASLYLGFSASIIWVAQGTYLTSIARDHARDYNLHEGAVIGDFNGTFWAMYALHQFVGNLLTFALLKNGKDGSTSGTTLLFIVFLCVMTLGTVQMCFLSKRSGNSKGESELSDAGVGVYSSLRSLSKSLSSALSDVRMLLVIPLIAYSSLQQAFAWSEFTKYVVTPVLGVSGVGIAMAVYGAFDGICSLAAGRLTSGLPSITSIVSVGAFVQAIVFIFLLLDLRIAGGLPGTLILLFMAALLGIGDGVLNTQLNALLGMIFKHDTEGAFAQLKIWQSASIAIVFFLGPHISFQTLLVIMLASLCLSYGCFLFLTLKVAKESPSTTSE
ncbi:UNC93-like protein 3 [Senna tora]|uniref:UNC93-like protein 3 n=1 Tax=Senna tora TaxID=362788 RepID=A0A834SPA7_9FABA|nr:UNC93-like protein 3 [Senna tora]